jgi:hypothetical protein
MEKKENKRSVIWAAVVGAAVLVAAVLAVVLPIVNINRDFDALIGKMTEFDTPRLVITDMSAENNFSGVAGEIFIDDENSAKVMIRDLSSLADGLKYDRRDTSVGAWDIRFKVIDGEESAEIYLAEDKVYFVKNDVKYIFVPKGDESAQACKNLYSRFSMFVS